MPLSIPAFNDTQTYPFAWLRFALESAPLVPGIMTPLSFLMSTATAGGLRLQVIFPSAAMVRGTSGTPVKTGVSHGLYMVTANAAIDPAVTFAASHATLPRLDQVCLRVRDSTDLAGGGDDATLVVLTGTATAGATLDNRTGAAALPTDHLRLYDYLVTAGSTTINTGNLRDRRARATPWKQAMFSNADTGLLTTTIQSIPGLAFRAELAQNQAWSITGSALMESGGPAYSHQIRAKVTAPFGAYSGASALTGGAISNVPVGQRISVPLAMNGQPLITSEAGYWTFDVGALNVAGGTGAGVVRGAGNITTGSSVAMFVMQVTNEPLYFTP